MFPQRFPDLLGGLAVPDQRVLTVVDEQNDGGPCFGVSFLPRVRLRRGSHRNVFPQVFALQQYVHLQLPALVAAALQFFHIIREANKLPGSCENNTLAIRPDSEHSTF